jgi:hypothetical protein
MSSFFNLSFAGIISHQFSSMKKVAGGDLKYILGPLHTSHSVSS